MPFESILYLGSGIAALGFAIGAFVFLAWAFLGRRGDPRRRRLRFVLSSATLFVASVLAAFSMFHLVLLPGSMQLITPDFRPPYDWCSRVLTAAVFILLYASAVFLVGAVYQRLGTRRRVLLTSLGCLLLTLAVCAADYALIYHVQVPAYDRYVLIEHRDWKTHVGERAPGITVVMLDGSKKPLSIFAARSCY